jgi:IS1 family transposase/transposase-like protein
MTCLCCNGETNRFGRFQNKNRIVQRYRCVRCGKTFSESQPLDGLRVDFQQACRVVHLLCESMGIRGIQRVTGLHQETILNILATAGQKAAAFLDSKVRNINAAIVQADEIHSFVFSKQQNTDKENLERGDQFTFLAVDPCSKLIISFRVSKRSRENSCQFLTDLKSRVTNRFQLNTDAWKIYSGSESAVLAVFGNEIDHATETKYFARPGPFLPRRVIGLRRKRRIGNPNMKLATTCHVERTNLTVRLFTRRFNRCTLGFSKKLENLKHAVALFVWHYNFVRKHAAHGFTPAYSAGLGSEEPMTIEQLLQDEK